MDELYRIAAQYHRKLHSFQAYGGFREPCMLLFLLAAVGAMAAAIALAVSASENDTASPLYDWHLVPFVLSLLGMHLARDQLILRRDQRIREGCLMMRRNRRDDCDGSVHICLLEDAFYCDRSRFLEVAQKIKRSIEIEETYNTRDRSLGESVMAFLSMPKSSSTLLALFAILATVVTLAGNPELTLSDFFGIVAGAGKMIFGASFLAVFLVLLIVVALRFYLRELSRVWTFIALAHSSDDAKRLSAVRNLVRDLNRFHTWQATAPAKVPTWKARVRHGLRRRTRPSARDLSS